jgi:hypothetical protein
MNVQNAEKFSYHPRSSIMKNINENIRCSTENKPENMEPGECIGGFTPEEDIQCEQCIRLFGKENAKMATVHGPGVIKPQWHLCAEHFCERFPHFRVPMCGGEDLP